MKTGWLSHIHTAAVWQIEVEQPQARWTEKCYKDVLSQEFKKQTAIAGEDCNKQNAG